MRFLAYGGCRMWIKLYKSIRAPRKNDRLTVSYRFPFRSSLQVLPSQGFPRKEADHSDAQNPSGIWFGSGLYLHGGSPMPFVPSSVLAPSSEARSP